MGRVVLLSEGAFEATEFDGEVVEKVTGRKFNIRCAGGTCVAVPVAWEEKWKGLAEPVARPREDGPTKGTNEMSGDRCAQVDMQTTKLLAESFPEVSETSLMDPTFRSSLLAQLRMQSGTHRMIENDTMPRDGESAGECVVRRHKVHSAKMKMEGRPTLTFSEFVENDKLLNEPLYLLHEQEQAGPELERERRVAKHLAEIDRAAKPLMAKGLTLAKARSKVMAEDPALSERYNLAVMGRPEPAEED